MTLQREAHREFVAECDDCHDLLYTGVTEFYLVPETLKQNGWDITKNRDGTWTHRCGTCWRAAMNPQADFEV